MKIMNILVLVLASLLLFSCATGPTDEEQDAVIDALRYGDASAALVELDATIESYTEEVVYDLDHGVLSFYAKDYETAIDDLSDAEDMLEYNSVSSVSEGAASLLTNDNAKAYSGSNYEMLYLKGLKALAYGISGDYEGAMVEVRRANIISRDYQLNVEEQASWIEDLVLAITPDPFRWLEIPEVADYTTSAFINYLSMIMYRASGDSGNAMIDFNSLKETVADQSLLSEDDVTVPAGMARVNFFALSGLIATKEEAAVMVESPNPLGDRVRHKVSWPMVVDRPNAEVESITVTCSNGQSVTLSLLEDVSELAKSNMAMDTKSKYLGSFYRGYTKMVAAQTAAQETYKLAMEAAQSALSAAGSNPLAALAANAAYKAAATAAQTAYDAALDAVNDSELADLRMARFLPDRLYAGGLTIAPGTYDFTVTYNTSAGAFTYSYPGVAVRSGAPNLVVSQCAR